MSSSDDAPLANALKKIVGSGAIHTVGDVPLFLPEIDVKGIGELALPLSTSGAEDLSEAAETAPYGKGEETLVDEEIRKCWQVDADDFDLLAPAWDDLLKVAIKDLKDAMGVAGKVTAEPYKLLLYGEGGHFLPHKDTEKVDQMFGSLIVAIPSAHTGGELVINHPGHEEVVVKFDSKEGLRRMQYVAFFADCLHEVKPVTSGYRLVVAFNLVLATRSTAERLNPPPQAQVDLLRPHLRELRSGLFTDPVAVLLDHGYTEKGFSVKGLKGSDRARAKALFGAAKAEELVAHLGLVTMYQMGELAPDGYQRWDDDEEESDAEMGEVYEESLTISHWRTPADKTAKISKFPIGEEDLISTQELAAGENRALLQYRNAEEWYAPNPLLPERPARWDS